MADRAERAATIAYLAEQMKDRGSWTGETHIQKSMYFLQELADGPRLFEFTMYLYGPFSFDLRDELSAMRADGLMKLIPKPPYGPTLEPTDTARRLISIEDSFIRPYEAKIEFIAEKLGQSGVGTLERMATTHYVKKKVGTGDPKKVIAEMRRLKPHFSEYSASLSLEKVREIEQSFQELGAEVESL